MKYQATLVADTCFPGTAPGYHRRIDMLAPGVAFVPVSSGYTA